jgi:hypothetical protein
MLKSYNLNLDDIEFEGIVIVLVTEQYEEDIIEFKGIDIETNTS